MLGRRWKRRSGEIGLIVLRGEKIVFVEVKSHKTLEGAALSLSRKQQNRIFNTAQNYLAESGARLNAETQFDMVLVDRHGRSEVLENAMAMGW